jgi:hypothetical protein
MSADTESEVSERQCWCCGQVTAEGALLRLGSHPEVGVCIDCGVYLGRRARDHQASAVRIQLRGAADSIRDQVVSRGWHERPVIGPVLLWINRRAPW